MVTQPSPAADAFCSSLREHGLVPLLLPSHLLQAVKPAPSYQSTIEKAKLVIITSQHVFSEQSKIADLPKRDYLTIGPSTERAAHAQGITSTQTPKHASSEGILHMLEGQNLNGKSVVILTGENPRPFLGDSLKKKGANVEYLFFYKRQPTVYTKDTLLHLAKENPVAISVHSGDGLRYLADTLSQNTQSPLWKTPLLLVSERYEPLAKSLGFSGKCLISDDSSAKELISALLA